MGLTSGSTGLSAVDPGLTIRRESPDDLVIALAGNPNVGKSTVFNALTGMNQHTGNWPGKTVTTAQGSCRSGSTRCILVDIPGTYSLMAHSAEEEVARDFLCFGEPDAAVVVCDATCLERSLDLVLQTIEITPNVVVCVNLMDEAEKKKIRVDLPLLRERLGVPVVGTSARSGEGLEQLLEEVCALCQGEPRGERYSICYAEPVERAAERLKEALPSKRLKKLSPRWVALRLLDRDEALFRAMTNYLGFDLLGEKRILARAAEAENELRSQNIAREEIKDRIASAQVKAAESVAAETVHFENVAYRERDRRLDRLLTGKRTGIPLMLLLLAFIFWLTITGANYPSALLSDGLFRIGEYLREGLRRICAPEWLQSVTIDGIYRVLAWVVSVMLPPMAIFFPLFTLLEDLGYLPRVAFNLDKYFQKAHACGKQALTMCMGFGCNAAGVVGCRIIDSPRERLIATVTNSFVPCNGRFPTLIAILTMFFAGAVAAPFQSVAATLLLMGLILLGIGMTFLVSRLLSVTLLKGIPSSFTLELPPFRRPQIGKVLVRSVFDRTLFVLGRAASVAAPAGLVIWILANISVGGSTLLALCSGALDPFARIFGMDGVILLAFILGFPANEIVLPLILMAYLSTGSLQELGGYTELKAILVQNGWTWATAVSVLLFSLMHWPCSTTCLTIRKETQSWKWTALSFLIPTFFGLLLCAAFTGAVRLLGLA